MIPTVYFSHHELPIVVIEGLREANDSLGESTDRDVVVKELTNLLQDDDTFTKNSVIKVSNHELLELKLVFSGVPSVLKGRNILSD